MIGFMLFWKVSRRVVTLWTSFQRVYGRVMILRPYCNYVEELWPFGRVNSKGCEVSTMSKSCDPSVVLSWRVATFTTLVPVQSYSISILTYVYSDNFDTKYVSSDLLWFDPCQFRFDIPTNQIDLRWFNPCQFHLDIPTNLVSNFIEKTQSVNYI